MASKENRFVKTYSQGVLDVMEIWVDRETGVNYLFHWNGSAPDLLPCSMRRASPW